MLKNYEKKRMRMFYEPKYVLNMHDITLKIIDAIEEHLNDKAQTGFIIFHNNAYIDKNFINVYFKTLEKDVIIIPTNSIHVPVNMFMLLPTSTFKLTKFIEGEENNE